MTTALIGTMTEPVMRNSSTSVAATTMRAANGRRSLSLALMSMSSAAMPPTSVSKAGWLSRSCATSADASGPWEVPAGVRSTTVRPGGVSGRTDVPTTPGVVASCCVPGGERGAVGSASAMTVTGSVPRAGNRSARVRATSRTSDERGRVRASPISKRALRNGMPSEDQHDHGGDADRDGVALHPAGEAVEAAGDVGDGSRRGDLAADRRRRTAAASVTAAAMQSRTTPSPAMPNEVRMGSPKTNSPHIATATVRAEKTTVLPAVAMVRTTASCSFDAATALLAEPVDHQQAVVDAEADAEHVDDVDREDRDVTEHGCCDEDGERGDDTGEGDEHRHAGGAESAEQEDHDQEGDRQGDGLATQEVLLRGGAELLPDEHVPADEHLGGVEIASDIGDLVRERRPRLPRRGRQ